VSGQLADHVLGFARLLRRAGLPVGPGQALDALGAALAVGVASRDDFYWALASTLVRRREELAIFDEAFQIWFRDPEAYNVALASILFASKVERPPNTDASRRVAEALAAARTPAPRSREPREPERAELDVTMNASSLAVLQRRDFEKMSAAEVAEAKNAIARMAMPRVGWPTRRLAADPRGERVDLRRTLRAALRAGGHDIPLAFRDRTTRPPPIVAICDISGSMERYSRMVLHFLHALTSARDRVTSFTFGTSLTNVTRWLAARDVDEALAKIGRGVTDWAGGTRIGASLGAFNRKWARRVLGQGAIVLLVTDGLEREDTTLLSQESARLRRSCRRLVWLNPLLRYEAFAPLAAGVRALLPNVDEHRPVHDLASLRQLAEALDSPVGARGRLARTQAR
jgi:uncharacterized protein with von Willebrand factor type A (vWA) domain